jgi:hypothetical protein
MSTKTRFNVRHPWRLLQQYMRRAVLSLAATGCFGRAESRRSNRHGVRTDPAFHAPPRTPRPRLNQSTYESTHRLLDRHPLRGHCALGQLRRLPPLKAAPAVGAKPLQAGNYFDGFDEPEDDLSLNPAGKYQILSDGRYIAKFDTQSGRLWVWVPARTANNPSDRGL